MGILPRLCPPVLHLMGIQCLGLVGSLGVLAPCRVLSPETATRTIFVQGQSVQ